MHWNGIRMPKIGDAFNICYNSLPFQLTGAQKRVITEIRDDMKSGHQMNRLLQGDAYLGLRLEGVDDSHIEGYEDEGHQSDDDDRMHCLLCYSRIPCHQSSTSFLLKSHVMTLVRIRSTMVKRIAAACPNPALLYEKMLS